MLMIEFITFIDRGDRCGRKPVLPRPRCRGCRAKKSERNWGCPTFRGSILLGSLKIFSRSDTTSKPDPRGYGTALSVWRASFVDGNSRLHGQRPSISSTNVQLKKVRTTTSPAKRPKLVNVSSIAIVFTISAATSTSRPSSKERPIRILY